MEKEVRPYKVLIICIVLLLSLFAGLAPTVAATDWVKKDLGNVGGTVFAVDTGDGNNDDSDEVYAASSNGGVYQLEQEDDKPKEWDITNMGYGEGSNFQMRAVVVGDGRDSGNTNVYAGGYDSGSWTGKMYEFYLTDDGWKKTQMGTGGWVIWDVDLGDGDNDDRNEVYAASYDGRVYEYSYSSSWNAKDIGYSSYYQRGVAVGDGDNDGDVEVYSAGGYWTYKHAYKYEYNSTSSSWDQTDLGQPPGGNNWGVITDIALGDGDNDGKNELYVTDYQYAYQIEYDSNSENWSWSTIFSNPNQYQNKVDVGDGDADNKTEVFVSSATDQIYMLTHSNGNWGSEAIGGGNGDMHGVAVGNGDNFVKQEEVYGGCADSHIYQFLVDVTPPPNPKVFSPTHEVGVWSNNNNIEVKWREPPDPSGIDGYSFEWSTSKNTVPDNTKDAEESVHGTESGPLEDGGNYYFHIRARDNALNWNTGATHFGPLKIDTGKPSGITVTINDDAKYTNEKLVTLGLTGNDTLSGMGAMAFSNDATTWPELEDWEEWSTARDDWDLTDMYFGGEDEDGTKTVYFQAMDKAGNIAPTVANDSIFLDRAKPVGLAIEINDDDQYTNDALVDLGLSASDPEPASGISKMMFSNDGVNWSSWENWGHIRSDWSLVDDSGGVDEDGKKTVYFKVKDKAGNVAGPMKDDIYLDRGKPESLLIIINGGEEYTNRTNVALNLSAEDPTPGTGVEHMSFSNDNSDWSSWEEFGGTKNPWSLTMGAGGVDQDGNKTVYFKVRDEVENVGGPARDRIFLDRAKPVSLSIKINDGAKHTNKKDVELSLSAVDPSPASGLFEMQLREGNGAWGDWEPWSTSRSHTLSGGDGSKSISFRVRDRAGNMAGPASDSIVLDTTPPTISNIKVISITDTSAVVTWSTDSPADGVVEYGTTTSYGNKDEEGEFVSDHSIALMGLSPETRYHFRVASTDEVGNGPTVSGDHTFTTKATPDTTAPILSNLRVEGITDKLAIVLWDTNEPADSYIFYGESTAYDLMAGNEAYIQKHSITLTGLKEDTEYYFRVESTDVSGNGPVNATGQFRTSVAPDTTPPKISNVKVTEMTDTMAVITWTTDEVADSIVEYGTTTEYGTVVTSSDYVREHTITLKDLEPVTTYYFIVRSTDPTGNGPTTSSQYSFKTDAVKDTTPPLISKVQSSGITNTVAVITWTTDELADSVVQYGTTTDYGETAEGLDFVKSHSITLSGLEPSTTYHFRVLSTDLSANGPSKSGDHTFKTKAVEDKEPPQLIWVKVEGIRSDVAVVMWKTNEPADSKVEFGTTVDYGLIIRDSGFVEEHSVLLTDLNSSTLYHFRVSSIDVSGNGPTVSQDYQFTTESVTDEIPPTIINATVTDVTSDSATIKWTTDEPATTLVSYGKNGSLGPPIGDDEHYYTDHSFELQNLEPDTRYTIMVLSDDPSGNRGSSTLLNFTTGKEVEPSTPPEPNPNPGQVDMSSLFWLLAILIIAVVAAFVGIFAYTRSQRGGRGRPAGRPERGRRVRIPEGEVPGVEEVRMEEGDMETLEMDEGVEDLGTLDMGEGAGMEGGDMETLEMDEGMEDLGTLDMGEGAGMEEGDVELGSTIAAVTAGTGTAAAAGRPRRRETEERRPVRKVKCPGCRTAIPIYSETQSSIECPECGKKGKIKPMKKARTRPETRTKRQNEGSPLASIMGTGEEIEGPERGSKRGSSPTGGRPGGRGRTGPSARARSAEGPKKEPKKVLTCSGCKGKVPVYTHKRPIRITCPSCEKSGTLKR